MAGWLNSMARLNSAVKHLSSRHCDGGGSGGDDGGVGGAHN